MSDVSPLTFVGIGLVVAYWFWLWAFFSHVRARIMRRVGRALDVRVRESLDPLDAGTYDTRDEDAPLRKRGVVVLADVVVLLAGTVGVAALLFIPAFLIAEGGVLLPLEGSITGRRAVLDVPPATITVAQPHVDASVLVRNDGRLPLQSCALVTSGYAARTGYVNGRSDYFDVAPRRCPRRARVAVGATAGARLASHPAAPRVRQPAHRGRPGRARRALTARMRRCR